jgi:hypothetical protein
MVGSAEKECEQLPVAVSLHEDHRRLLTADGAGLPLALALLDGAQYLHAVLLLSHIFRVLPFLRGPAIGVVLAAFGAQMPGGSRPHLLRPRMAFVAQGAACFAHDVAASAWYRCLADLARLDIRALFILPLKLRIARLAIARPRCFWPRAAIAAHLAMPLAELPLLLRWPRANLTNPGYHQSSGFSK